MSINCCEICFAIIVCTIITIVWYIASWYNYNEEEQEELKESNTSNVQCLENDEVIPRTESNYDLEKQHILTAEDQTTDEIKNEKSDVLDEDLRTRVIETESSDEHSSDGYVNIDDQNTFSEYEPIVRSDSKIGRLHLSIRYDNERSQLIVRILDTEDLIESKQVYAREIYLTCTLIGPYNNDNDTEKHTRIIVDNPAVIWKEPMTFCSTFENAKKQNLYVNISNKTGPAAPPDREISISLNVLNHENEEINQWFNLQFVQSSY